MTISQMYVVVIGCNLSTVLWLLLTFHVNARYSIMLQLLVVATREDVKTCKLVNLVIYSSSDW